jgi:ATP-dependent helicase/nuclease subunit A
VTDAGSAEKLELTPEQRAAVLAPGNVRVRAGAGSGKTEVLAHRFIALVTGDIADREPLSPEQIAAITFTDKATYDMRARIAQVLDTRLKDCTDEALRERLGRARRLLPLARISTIHGFCARILRENPVEARLDPDFDVLDEVDSATFLNETCAELLVAAVRGGDPAARHLVAARTLRGTSQRKGAIEIVMDLARSFDRLGRPPAWLVDAAARTSAEIAERFRVDDCARALCAKVDELAARTDLSEAAQKAVDNLRDQWPALRGTVERINASSEPDDLSVLEELEALLPRAQRMQKELVLSIRRAKPGDPPGLIDLLEQAYGAHRAAPRIRDAAALLARIIVEIRRRKRAGAVVTFDDLLIHTRDTLARNPQVLARYRDAIRALLVDEYQDTDPVQHDVVRALSEPRDGLPAPSLFAVGDEKQSIYRFRGADVRVFRAPLAPAPSELTLSLSRRSTPVVLDFVNAFAAHVMRPGAKTAADYRVEFTDDHKLAPHTSRTEHPHTAVEVCLMPAGSGDDALERRRIEARFIAHRLRSLVGSRTQIFDRKLKRLRDVRWSDMAILFRSFTEVAVYERALDDLAIDYYTVQGRGFFGCREIVDLSSLLNALDDPQDDIALAATLRSPLFGLSDQCLLEIALHLDDARHGDGAGPRTLAALFADDSQDFDWLSAGRDEAFRASATLRELRPLRERLPVADIIERALDLTRFEAVLLAQRRGRQRVANVRKLVERARAFESHGVFGFADFAISLRQLIEEEPREAQAQILGESEDVVRLMTIHQAKGLEFPVAVVADMGRRPYREYSNYALSPVRGLILCDTSGSGHHPIPNPLIFGHREAEHDEEDAEADRLLYVAITRARDRLILSESSTDTWSRQLREFIGEDTVSSFLQSDEAERQATRAGARFTLVRITPLPTPSVAETTRQAPPLDPRHAELAARRVAFEPPTDSEIITNPTALAEFDRCPRQYMLRRIMMLPEHDRANAASGAGARAGTDALEAGSVAHAALERLASRLGTRIERDEIETLLRELAVGTALDRRRIAEIARDLARYADERARTAPGEKIVGRELPFFINISDGGDFTLYVRGQIDLLAESAGALIVRDYKYARVDGDPSAYDVQLRAYALAVSEAYPDRALRGELHYLRERTEAREIPLPPSAEIRAQLLSLGRAMLDSRTRSHYPKKPASPEVCRTLECGYIAHCWRAA